MNQFCDAMHLHIVIVGISSVAFYFVCCNSINSAFIKLMAVSSNLVSHFVSLLSVELFSKANKLKLIYHVSGAFLLFSAMPSFRFNIIIA